MELSQQTSLAAHPVRHTASFRKMASKESQLLELIMERKMKMSEPLLAFGLKKGSGEWIKEQRVGFRPGLDLRLQTSPPYATVSEHQEKRFPRRLDAWGRAVSGRSHTQNCGSGFGFDYKSLTGWDSSHTL